MLLLLLLMMMVMMTCEGMFALCSKSKIQHSRCCLHVQETFKSRDRDETRLTFNPQHRYDTKTLHFSNFLDPDEIFFYF